MKKTFWLIILLIYPLFVSDTLAGDFAKLNFIGFSLDGKYLAFEEYGTQDGSGFPYSNVFIIDVVKNSYAAPSVTKRIDDESASEETVRAMTKKLSAANLRKFKIVAGNTGNLVVARLLTDLDAEEMGSGGENKDQTVRFVEERSSNYAGNNYELVLKTSSVKLKRCDYDTDNPILKLQLGLKHEGDSPMEKILQTDTTVPENRGCPNDYSIQNVYLYKNNIAVFVNIYTMGFEGPDMRYLVVTGNYK